MKVAMIWFLLSHTHAAVNMSCGFAPFPPINCKVGPCVCDDNGDNCHWTFICK